MSRSMKALDITVLVALSFAGQVLEAALAPGASLVAQEREPVTRESLEEMMEEVSNWGRWGEEDQVGTLNLVTPERTAEAARLVRAGISVSLAHDMLKEEAADVPSPFGHTISGTGARGTWTTDRIDVGYHGHTYTHLDALCHMAHKGLGYNGFTREEVATESGCARLGVLNAGDGVVTRGVLMDIARLKGVDYLDLGSVIYPEDLEAWEEEAGLRVRSGDVLLVRSGRWARRADVGPWSTASAAPGLHPSVVPWLKDRGVAMLGSDYTSDRLPHGVEGAIMPIHQLTIVGLGMPLFDNLDLEAVARTAAEQGRWEFMFIAAPLRVPGGTGSPINPLAVF